MKYYKNLSPDGSLMSIGTGIGGIEITGEEYLAELSAIREKADWVGRVWKGDAVLEDVPARWQEEVSRRVSQREAAGNDPELTDDEALEILLGGAV